MNPCVGREESPRWPGGSAHTNTWEFGVPPDDPCLLLWLYPEHLPHARLNIGDAEWFSNERTAHPLEKDANLVAEDTAGDEDHPLCQFWPEEPQSLMQIHAI